jgi:DNA ligase (NAD+)
MNQETIDQNIALLKKCAKLYETDGTSPLDDLTYDNLYAEMKKIVPQNPFFSEVGGIDDEHVYGTKCKHKYVMGSLNKDPNPKEFGDYFEKTFGKDIDKVVAILQLKVDGSSFCLHYQDGKLIQALSRGTGIIGIDYTNNAQYIRGVKQEIKARGYVEIKGEVYKNKQDFEKYCSKDFANDRNFTSGAINQKDPLVTKERKLDFVAYEVRGVNFKTETEKLQFLVDNGFETLKDYTCKIDCKGRTVEDVVRAITKYMDKFDQNALPFSVDGIVFKLNDIEWAEELGTTDDGKRPKAHRAIKYPTEKKETILEGIEWNIGRTGQLTPVGLLKPVHLAGTTVTRVTLHNLKEMERLGITKTGCTVEVAKQGNIIPKVQRMTKEGNKVIDIPDTCPSCSMDLNWDDTRTSKRCDNESCPSQVDRRIEHFFKTIGTLGIGPGIISKLTTFILDNEPMVASISDMYKLKPHQKVLAEIFGPNAAENILESIDSVKEVSLAKFIESLGIGKIGSMAKEITAIAPTVKDIDNLKAEDITNIRGFSDTKANSFLRGWKAQRKEIEQLLKSIDIVEVKLDSNKLSGKKFCFTGSFSNPTRSEMEKSVEDNGGKLSSVSKELTALVWDGEMMGSKLEKAKKLGLSIINQKDFLSLLK